MLDPDDEPETEGITCWFCPICSTLTLYSGWQEHVRDEHSGHVVKEVHPVSTGPRMNIIHLPPGPLSMFVGFYTAVEVFPLRWCHTRTRSRNPVYLLADNDA